MHAVLCLFLGSIVNPKKMAKPIEVPFGMWTRVVSLRECGSLRVRGNCGENGATGLAIVGYRDREA